MSWPALLRLQIVFHDLLDRFRSRGGQCVDVDTFLKEVLGDDGGEGVEQGAVKGKQEAFRGERSQRDMDWNRGYESGVKDRFEPRVTVLSFRMILRCGG